MPKLLLMNGLKQLIKSAELSIISYLSQRPDITFAYVFGSVLTEYFIEGKSDIDLAIMGADKEFTFYDLQEMAMDISDLLPGHPEVDMVDLMTDAPVLIHQIMEFHIRPRTCRRAVVTNASSAQ